MKASSFKLLAQASIPGKPFCNYQDCRFLSGFEVKTKHAATSRSDRFRASSLPRYWVWTPLNVDVLEILQEFEMVCVVGLPFLSGAYWQ